MLGPHDNSSDNDSDKDFLVIEEPSDIASDVEVIGEKNDVEPSREANLPVRSTVGGLTIRRAQSGPGVPASSSMTREESVSSSSMQSQATPITFPSESAKKDAYKKHQEEFVSLFKAALKTKKKMSDVIAFLQDKDCAYLDFNAIINRETLIIHLMKAVSTYRKPLVELARDVLQYILTHARLETINWNAQFRDDTQSEITALAWLLNYADTKKDSHWVTEPLSRMFNFRNPPMPVPEWITKLNWDAKPLTGNSAGKSCLWRILGSAIDDDVFAQSLFNYLIQIDVLKKLDWDTQNSLEQGNIPKNISCLTLLTTYCFRQVDVGASLFYPECKIPLEKYDPKGIKWDQQFYNPRTKSYETPINKYVALMMQNVPWVVNFMEKVLTPLPPNHIDWSKIGWNNQITAGPYKGKTVFSVLLMLACQGKKIAQKIIQEHPLNSMELNIELLEGAGFIPLLHLALTQRQEWALKVLKTLLAKPNAIKWSEVKWTSADLQLFTESVLSGDFGEQISLSTINNSESALWKTLDWNVILVRGPNKEQPMLQRLVEKAAEGNTFAQKIIGELNHETLDWKKVNFKVICKNGNYKDKPLNVALFESSFFNPASFSKSFVSMTKAFPCSSLDWKYVNCNLTRNVGSNQGQTLIASFLISDAINSAPHGLTPAKLLPVQPATWKGVLWNAKLLSGPYKDQTLWSSLVQRAAEGKTWEAELVRKALGEIAVQQFTWDTIDLDIKVKEGPHKGKTRLEWLVIEAMYGEPWAQLIVFNINLARFDWAAIDWAQKLTKGIYAGKTLLNSFIHHYLDNSRNDSHPLFHVLNKVPDLQLHFRDVSWGERLSNRHSFIYELTKAAESSVIAQKVMEGIIRDDFSFQKFDWNEAVETELDCSSPIWFVVISAKKGQNWATRTLDKILAQLPVETIDWRKEYSMMGDLLSNSLDEILPQPYSSQVALLLKLREAEGLLKDNSQKRKLIKLLESLDVLAFSVQNSNPNVMPLLAKFYRKMGDFSRYTQWVMKIPKHCAYYEEGRVELVKEMLKKGAAKKGDEVELEKSTDFMLDLIFSLPEVKGQPLRQELVHFLRDQFPERISEPDALFLETFKNDKKSFLEVLKRIKMGSNPELTAQLQGEIKRTHELKQKAEKEREALQKEKKRLEDELKRLQRKPQVNMETEALQKAKKDLQDELKRNQELNFQTEKERDALRSDKKRLEDEMKHVRADKVNAEKERDDLEAGKKIYQANQKLLVAESVALHETNQALEEEKSYLLSQLQAFQKQVDGLNEQHQKDTEEKESLKRHADSLDHQREEAVNEKIDALVEVAKFESLWKVEKGKGELQIAAFRREVDSLKQGGRTSVPSAPHQPAAIATPTPQSRSLTFAFSAQQAQQQKVAENPNEAPREPISAPLKKRYKPGAGEGLTLDDLL